MLLSDKSLNRSSVLINSWTASLLQCSYKEILHLMDRVVWPTSKFIASETANPCSCTLKAFILIHPSYLFCRFLSCIINFTNAWPYSHHSKTHNTSNISAPLGAPTKKSTTTLYHPWASIHVRPPYSEYLNVPLYMPIWLFSSSHEILPQPTSLIFSFCGHNI